MAIWGSLSSCIWFNPENLRNYLSSMIAGILFFSGWWFLIDAMALYPHMFYPIDVILGILGTLSLFMVNSVTQAQIDGYVGFSRGCTGALGARIWIFVGYVFGLAPVISAIWVMVATFNSEDANVSNWPGISLLMQNVCIFVASLVYKFGRSDNSYRWLITDLRHRRAEHTYGSISVNK